MGAVREELISKGLIKPEALAKFYNLKQVPVLRVGALRYEELCKDHDEGEAEQGFWAFLNWSRKHEN
jgi:hypothetical protein